MCKFNEAWIGICKGENVKGKDYCEKHLDVKCEICGNQATHNCAETMQFVCGTNLCDSLECKLEHFYRTHGYAFFEISDLEEKLNKTSKLVVSKIGYEVSNDYHDWYNKKYLEALQVARLVYSNDGKVKVYKSHYRYMAKEKSEIPQLFEGAFYEEEIKKLGVFYSNDILYLDKEYSLNELAILEEVKLY